MSAPRLRIEYWPVSRLKMYGRNPRVNDDAISKMRASIREFGFAVPVLARSATGEICDGHLRFKSGVAEGMTEIPVIPCDGWTDAQMKAFRIAANSSANWAEFDVGLLAGELADLQEMNFDLALTGFDPDELGRMISGEMEADAGKGPGHASRNADRDKMLHVVVYMQTLATFEEAIRLAGATTRAAAVMEICRSYIANKNAEVGGISLQ